MSATTSTRSPETSALRYVNIHGRRWGRGVRPWLIAAKLITVSLYVGGLAVVTFLWWAWGVEAVAANDSRRDVMLNLLGLVMTRFVVPALLLALVVGVLLLLQHPREFFRMRWLRVKLLLLLVLVPAGHFFCRAQSVKLRDPSAATDTQVAAARRLLYGLAGTLSGTLLVVIIGRTKPRLGQRYGRAGTR